VMGPHTFNFAEASELALAAGAAKRVGSMEEGLRAAVGWAENRPDRAAAARAAEGFASAHRGAAERTANAVLAMVAAKASGSPRDPDLP